MQLTIIVNEIVNEISVSLMILTKKNGALQIAPSYIFYLLFGCPTGTGDFGTASWTASLTRC